MSFFLVEMANGPSWDTARGRREQERFAEHAAFMDALVDAGFVVLGGPVGEGDGDYALLMVSATDEEAVRDRLRSDPWFESVLEVAAIRRWTLWLGSAPSSGTTTSG